MMKRNLLYKMVIVVLAVMVIMTVGCKDEMRHEDDFIEGGGDGGDVNQEENPYWAWVGSFPGWIDIVVTREDFTPVEVDGVYQTSHPDNRLGFNVTPWFSTGFYAPPAEKITIVKPTGLTGKVNWRIGAWNCTLPDNVVLKRYNKVYETGTLDSDTTVIMSYFGGHIYIEPEELFAKPETFMIKGAVKSPDFILGETDLQEWLETIKNTKVPFGELRGKKSIWTMSVSTLSKITNPKDLLEYYDDIIENDYNSFHGLSDNAASALDRSLGFPVRIVQDIQLCSGEHHAGYPIVYNMENEELGTDVDEMRLDDSGFIWFQELGNNFKTWCWVWADGNGQVKNLAVLLPYYYSRNRLLKSWPAGGVNEWDFVIQNYVLKDFVGKDFDTDSQLDNNNARLLPFIQLAQQYGWKLYAYLGQCSRELAKKDAKTLKSITGLARREFFCKRVCEYANADLRPFFDAWGMQYGPYAEADMAKLPAYTGEKFWEKWQPGLLPDFEKTMTPSSIKLPDNNYNMMTSDFDQTVWIVDSACVTSEGKPENVIDGNISGQHWASDSKGIRPNYRNPQPFIAFDIHRPYLVEKVYIYFRNFNYAHAHPETIRVDVKINPEDEWESLGEFKTEYKLQVWHEWDVAVPKGARYVNLVFVRGHLTSGKTDWDYDQTGGVSLQEFKLGGKVYVSDGDDDTGVDPDFPYYSH
ncbi:MAG: M60 family metallopeptidase [Odoribacter sp.]|nr:M60 family metallopeptidase [Odoribacter sp.]